MADHVQRRTPARSGKSSYGAPVVIRGRSTTHLEVLPQYISRSDGGHACPKLRYWKKTAGAYRVGFPAEFTLDENETRKLISALQDILSVADASEDGDYLVVKLDGDVDGVGHHGSDNITNVIRSIASDTRLIEALADLPDAQHILARLEGSIRVVELENAISALENALVAGETDEAYYQTWIESHCWIFGNAYAMRDSVRNIAIGDQVDALLAATANGYRDIVELKRPDHKVINYDASHKSYYWQSDTAKAIGQCHRYMDALHEGASNGLRDHPEIIAHHPRAIIVIGRSDDWSTDRHKALHGLNARLHGITVMTYDQMLAQGHQLLDTLRGDNASRAGVS